MSKMLSIAAVPRRSTWYPARSGGRGLIRPAASAG